MYLVKTPSIVKPIAKDFVWKINTKEKLIFLTFDDGPTTGVTEDVLNILSEFNASATFFCLGKNVVTNPEIFARIKNEGHEIGSHSYSHPDGWKTPNISYLKDVLKGNSFINAGLFRPPYGHISLSQTSALKKRFRLIMWDVISGDFDQSITPEKCLDNVVSSTVAGSIVVFHDSLKARNNMLYALNGTLEHFSQQGFRFVALTNEYVSR